MLCNQWQFLKFGFYDKAKIHAIKKQHMKRAYPMEECCCQIVCFLFYCILCQTVECCCQSHVLLLICFMFNQSFHVKKKRKFCFFFSFYNTQHQCSVCFWEEIKACAAVCKCYVMNACNFVQSIILLPHMVGTSFVIVALKRLNVSELKY